jgi:membrane protease YdiL (CAAX protease family)
MLDSDARPLVLWGQGLRERVADIGRFVLRPQFVPAPLAWGRAPVPGLLVALGIVFAVDLAISTLVAAAFDAWGAGTGFLPKPLELEATLAEDLFNFLILAPVMEELAFRGWLTGRIAALRFAIHGFAALGLFSAALYVPTEYQTATALAGVAAVLAGLIQWSRTRAQDSAVPPWFTRHFHWIVWGSSLAFGLIHLGNYEPLAHPLGLLVVLPQTIGGLLLAYTRTRLGLSAAIAHHAVYNAVFLASDYGWW